MNHQIKTYNNTRKNGCIYDDEVLSGEVLSKM